MLKARSDVFKAMLNDEYMFMFNKKQDDKQVWAANPHFRITNPYMIIDSIGWLKLRCEKLLRTQDIVIERYIL